MPVGSNGIICTFPSLHTFLVEDTLGSLVRRLRTARRLSQQQVAREANLGRAALARWEGDTRRPHQVDLDVLLHTLGATSEQRRYAHELLRLSRLTTTRKTNPPPFTEESVQSSVPVLNSGDLLRALRMRRGLSQAVTAARIGVAERTLRRWERLEVQPSATQLHTLCHVLGAAKEELAALSATNPFSCGVITADINLLKLEVTTPYEIMIHAYSLYYNDFSWRRVELKELNFFLLASLAEPHAGHSEVGQRALAHVYGFLASYLSTNKRWSEASLYAHRALDLWPSSQPPDDVLVLTALAAARAAVYQGVRPAPHKGIEILRYWLDVTPWPSYRGWILGDLALYIALSGDPQQGAALAQQARDVTATSPNPIDGAFRALDHAQILIWGAQYTQAQRIIEETSLELPVKSLLLGVEMELHQGAHTKAQERLSVAWTAAESIKHPHVEAVVPHLQAQARRLELKIGSALAQ